MHMQRSCWQLAQAQTGVHGSAGLLLSHAESDWHGRGQLSHRNLPPSPTPYSHGVAKWMT